MLRKKQKDFQQGIEGDYLIENLPSAQNPYINQDADPANSPNGYAAEIIDRFNAFENTTENRNYNSDYRSIVPQISIRGCEVPDTPARHEKRAIRKVYNAAGAGLLIHFVGVQLIAVIVVTIVQLLLMGFNSESVPALQNINTATDWITQYVNNSSIMMSVNLFACMLMNVMVFLIGCKVTKVNIKSLFCTENLNNRKMIMYIIIALFIQFAGEYLYMFIGYLMSLFNLQPYSPDFTTGLADEIPNIRKFIVIIIYTCIIAPITEELLFRGFLLKNLSKVSQRFGIFVSAIMFGLIHENIAQGLLGFFVGLLMGYVVIKHNSLVPSIIIHLCVNINGMIWSVLSELSPDKINVAYMIYGAIISIIGLIMLIYMIAHNRLPKATKAQKKRSWPIIFTSWSFILVTICHVAMTVIAILYL